jgi:hypothetical protein
MPKEKCKTKGYSTREVFSFYCTRRSSFILTTHEISEKTQETSRLIAFAASSAQQLRPLVVVCHHGLANHASHAILLTTCCLHESFLFASFDDGFPFQRCPSSNAFGFSLQSVRFVVNLFLQQGLQDIFQRNDTAGS